MSSDHPLQGGCLCGVVRYEVRAPIEQVWHCHCSICRKCEGALYPTYGSFARSGSRLLQGGEDLKAFDSSAELHRDFCGTCRAHIFGTVDSDPDSIGLSIGTLDDGADPGGREGNECHIFWESRAGWYEPADDLPKTQEYGDPLDYSQP